MIYTIELPTDVYGGTLDVVSGVLTVDRAMVDLGTLTWSYQSDFQRFNSTGIQSAVKRPSSNSVAVNAICSIYEVKSTNAVASSVSGIGVSTSGTIGVCDTSYTDATTFKTAMDGVQLVYELATPTTYQLTPTEVELLKGNNNVWSDCGEVEVTYSADIPQDGAFKYPIKGTYEITYTAEDECGNETEQTRTIEVI